MNGRERFPYELLVQIYDQRLQILWFAIAFSLAFLGAFYISLTDHYTGDLGFTPLAVMLIGYLISISLFFFECRNYEIMLNNHKKYFIYMENRVFSECSKQNKSEKEQEELVKQHDCYLESKSMFSFAYNKLINFIFILLYFVEGLSIGTASLIAYTQYMYPEIPSIIESIGVLAVIFLIVGFLLFLSLLFLGGTLLWFRVPKKVLEYDKNPKKEDGYIKNTVIKQPKVWSFILVPIVIGLTFAGLVASIKGFAPPKKNFPVEIKELVPQPDSDKQLFLLF